MELVETTIDGRCLWVVTVKMPFVYKASFVSCGFQYGGDSGVGRKYVGSAYNSSIAFRIYLVAGKPARCTHIVTDCRIAGVLPRD